ncbi:hypothetical protein DL96DRAFT_1823506 [Flagelloscypha sp. PMI_526]|nr:hypothetical protein DL96DRAFT_1823506 [Flagelloscypha sp. PMI_526]
MSDELPQSSNSPTLHERFQAADADMCIVSSDNVLFKVHSKNLTVNSGAFPADLGGTLRDEPAYFDESSTILGYLFAFIYADQDHPTLIDCDMQTILSIGIAANKYMVPAAKNACFHMMRQPAKETDDTAAILGALAYLNMYHSDAPDETYHQLSMQSLDWSAINFAEAVKVVKREEFWNPQLISTWRLWKMMWMQRDRRNWDDRSAQRLSVWARQQYAPPFSFASCLRTVREELI